MIELLPNFVSGRWQTGQGSPTPLMDPVRGLEIVSVDATGLDLRAGFEFSRRSGGTALRAMTYRERARLLAIAVKVLQSHRDEYYEIATANSGTVKTDSAIDIDGAIFTLSHYAKLGAELGDTRLLLDGGAGQLGKDPLFQTQHIQTPVQGVALFINSFNFPAWSLWEKAAPALLSGVPVIVKPATSTAWLTQRMVRDVIDAGVFPLGALSIVCGSSKGLMNALQPFDVVSFTGSAETAQIIRTHSSVARHSVRANIEADSLNAALLLPCKPGDDSFELLVTEVVREMTSKSGQKCTAIRRVVVPAELLEDVGQAVAAKLSTIVVGNPRNPAVQMGSLVSRAQLNAVREGTALLREQATVILDGEHQALVDASTDVSACIGPTLLRSDSAEHASRVHDIEVFGPLATLVPYRSSDEAVTLIRRGRGSLVASIFGVDPDLLAKTSVALASTSGRVHIVSPDVSLSHTGHGNVMPMSIHGGPGRAGGGEELGGLRALNFFHQRTAVQASGTVLSRLHSE